MTDPFAATPDEAAFERYLDALAAAMQHRSRERPLRAYCTGLLLPGGRKSVEPIAARLEPAHARTMHKTLLNFVSEGSWSDEAVLAAMRRHVLPALHARSAIRFWIVDECGLPKKGKHSVGVGRQYCGVIGDIANCQVLVSLSVANAVAALPLAARLYLPEEWARDPARRAATGVPLDIAFQTKPDLALQLIQAARAAGVPPGVVLADEVYGSVAAFRLGVRALGLDYAVAVRSPTEVGPPRHWRRAAFWQRRDRAALEVRTLAGPLPPSAWKAVTWRDGSGPDLSGRFAMTRVRVGRDGIEEDQTLLIEWPEETREPVGYWLVSVNHRTPLKAVVDLVKGRWWIEQNYRDLKQELGLGACEGRGWRGFHHHVTLVLATYGFLVMRRCQQPQPAGGRAGFLSFPVVEDPAHPPVRPERHAPTSIATMSRRLTVGLARRLARCPCCHRAGPPPRPPRHGPLPSYP